MQLHKLCFIALFVAHTTFAVNLSLKTSNIAFLGDAELGPASDGVSRSGALSMTRDANPFSHGQALDNSGAGPAGFLGILNKTNNGNSENHVFAVEFDVFQDKHLGDINDNHVGVDVNSLTSVVAEKAGYWVQTVIGKRKLWRFKEVKLSDGERYKAWIEYKNFEVRVTLAPEAVKKPQKPLIVVQLNLSEVFLENMYTGFAGAMGRGVERHDIWSWTFQNSA
ncbi:unnamed protein product [Eruca vesicaria subsp. sativa]|uniref:Legume lectin domain-containing protein n=1 Tax=Eruca vesicaria subsp. sativa TaxID=29727 RepID=A0ABC8LPW8_ERUVS|nr:unnamed protein product [Eruca vesicaria subsp. sativa]